MKKLKSEEAITILKGMKVDIPVPKAAVTQIERNEAIEMAINALKCSEILNSSDTISRQAVIDALQDRYKLYSWDDGGAQKAEIGAIIREIYDMSSAQPEMVRCKDCKHHHYEGEDIPYCDRIDYGYGWKDDDYCSMAERRTDE